MRHEPLWSHVSRKLVVLLLAVAVPPAATLVWLGLQLLTQDRALLAPREAGRHQAEAHAVARNLDSALAGAERLLSGGPVPAGMARATMTPDGVIVKPNDALLWLPVSRADRAPADASFDEAEALEYGGAVDRATALYQQAARSSNRATRAGALMRLARIHRHARRWDAALAAYRRVVLLGDVAVVDAPADLQARRETCSVLEAAGRLDALSREAAALQADFIAGRWGLDQAAWELTARDVEHWTGKPVPRPVDRERLSTAVALLCHGVLDRG